MVNYLTLLTKIGNRLFLPGFFCFAFYLFEPSIILINISLVCIVLNGDRFGLQVGLDGFDAFFEANVVLDVFLAVVAMHLWCSLLYNSQGVISESHALTVEFSRKFRQKSWRIFYNSCSF